MARRQQSRFNVLQIAELKRETHMVDFLSSAANGSATSKGSSAAAKAPQNDVPDSDKYI